MLSESWTLAGSVLSSMPVAPAYTGVPEPAPELALELEPAPALVPELEPARVLELVRAHAPGPARMLAPARRNTSTAPETSGKPVSTWGSRT